MKRQAGNGRSFGRETLGNSRTRDRTPTCQCGPGVEPLERRWRLFTAPLGPEFRANTYTGGYQDFPTVAMDASGNFVVAWHNQDRNASTDDGVYWQRFDAAGQRQGAETRANTYTTDVQQYASVGMDGTGNFVVAWQSRGQDGSDFGVYAQRYGAAGQPLGTEFRVNTTPGDRP